MSTLSLNNVTYKYRSSGTAAVKDATCSFEPGRLYAIVGPSGSGKSTLLSMMAGLDLPTEGEVSYDGESLRDMDLDRYRREDISMIFQAFQLFPLLTVIENVCYPMELVGVDPKEAKERAGAVSGESRHSKTDEAHSLPPYGRSHRGGNSQSVASGARTFLADDPRKNVDDAKTENIMAILKSLAHNDGYCVIVVTHDMEVAKEADTVFRMVDGTVTLERQNNK